jgi:hypothetical protein
MSNADLVRLEPGLRAHCLLAEYDVEDRGLAGVDFAHSGADDETPVPLRPEEQAAIAASKAAAARGEFATDEQVRAVWAKHGL